MIRWAAETISVLLRDPTFQNKMLRRGQEEAEGCEVGAGRENSGSRDCLKVRLRLGGRERAQRSPQALSSRVAPRNSFLRKE